MSSTPVSYPSVVNHTTTSDHEDASVAVNHLFSVTSNLSSASVSIYLDPPQSLCCRWWFYHQMLLLMLIYAVANVIDDVYFSYHWFWLLWCCYWSHVCWCWYWWWCFCWFHHCLYILPLLNYGVVVYHSDVFVCGYASVSVDGSSTIFGANSTIAVYFASSFIFTNDTVSNHYWQYKQLPTPVFLPMNPSPPNSSVTVECVTKPV